MCKKFQNFAKNRQNGNQKTLRNLNIFGLVMKYQAYFEELS